MWLTYDFRVGTFNSAVAFSQGSFQPFLAIPFIVKFVHKLLFTESDSRWDVERSAQHALIGEEGLGFHTSVVLFLKEQLAANWTELKPLRVLEWLWAPMSRPNGVQVFCTCGEPRIALRVCQLTNVFRPF
jgi:hypothetical protein